MTDNKPPDEIYIHAPAEHKGYAGTWCDTNDGGERYARADLVNNTPDASCTNKELDPRKSKPYPGWMFVERQNRTIEHVKTAETLMKEESRGEPVDVQDGGAFDRKEALGAVGDLIIYTEEERDGMMAAYERAVKKGKGDYESLFAVASYILRKRNIKLRPEVETIEGLEKIIDNWEPILDQPCNGGININRSVLKKLITAARAHLRQALTDHIPHAGKIVDHTELLREVVEAYKGVEDQLDVDVEGSPDHESIGWCNHNEICTTFGDIRRMKAAIARINAALGE